MNSSFRILPRTLSARRATICGALCLAFAVGVSHIAESAETAQSFSSPENAMASLTAAMTAEDWEALRSIFGPALKDIENPDREQATNEFTAFAAAIGQARRLVRESDSKYVLEIGTNRWPFPVPIVQQEGTWSFDIVAGKEELLNRRIGRNELAVLDVVRACVDAQREYAAHDHDGDQVLEYAQRLASSPGAKDGLYWPPDLDAETSPLGPLVAEAQVEGYSLGSNARAASPQPFHGYYFKMLTRQGKHAPGAKYDYIINGNMIGGFAFAAWPAKYGESGIMTFIVNHQGRVYEKDLGKKTADVMRKLSAYDPDRSWRESRD